MEMHEGVRWIKSECHDALETRLEVERIPNIEEDMLMIGMTRMEPAWCYERLMC